MPIEPDPVALNKVAIIERSLRRMQQEYQANPELDNHTHVDALTLNIERACQAAIDLAMHVVAGKRLGLPQSSSDAFRLLYEAKVIDSDTHKAMVAMTGFRNVAIHEYQQMDMSVLHDIAQRRWTSLVTYCRAMGMTIKL